VVHIKQLVSHQNPNLIFDEDGVGGGGGVERESPSNYNDLLFVLNIYTSGYANEIRLDTKLGISEVLC
jgi:hypothetical protein